MKDEDKTKEQLIDELARLRQRNTELMLSEIKLKRTEHRLNYLNRVLLAIRNVNQLIVRESNRDKLLKRICDTLTQTRGYYNTWIVLLDESGKLVTTAESGLGKDFLPMVELLKRGKLTTCGQKALSQSDVTVTEDPVSTCTDCPLSAKYSGRASITVRLEYKGNACGIMSASISRAFIPGPEEQSLFKEVAEDIAFALHNIELEEERKQVEETLKESEEFSSSLLTNSPNPILVINPDTSVRYVNPALKKLTGLTSAEIIGKKAPYPWWTEETLPKTSRDLEKAMQKGARRLEELFKKKNGERFWVEITSRPVTSNGEFKYYLACWVDITERKRAEAALRESNERYPRHI